MRARTIVAHLGLSVAGACALLALVGGVAMASGSRGTADLDPSAPPPTTAPPTTAATPTTTPVPSPTEDPTSEDPTTCLTHEVTEASPTAPPPPTAPAGYGLVAFNQANPPKPETIEVKQIVKVCELFEAPKAPKVGDKVKITLDISKPSKLKEAVQKLIDEAGQGGTVVTGVEVTATVYQVDDLGALVVYVQLTGVSVKTQGPISAVSSTMNNGPKFALGVIVK